MMGLAYITNFILLAKIVLPSFPTDKMSKSIDLQVDVPRAKVITYRYYETRNDTLRLQTLMPVREYHFSKRGELISIKRRNEKTGQVDVQYDFDKHTRIIRFSGYDTYSIYKYDEKNYTSVEFTFLNNGKLITKTIAFYDKQNNLVKKEIYRENGGLANIVSYRYNQNKQLVQELFVNTPNGFGVTIDGTQLGGKKEFTLWPNDTTIYQYMNSGDTLIVNKNKNSKPQSITKTYHVGDTLFYKQYGYSMLEKKFKHELTVKTAGKIKIELLYVFSEVRYYYDSDELQKIVRYENGNPYIVEYYSYSAVNDEKGNWIKKETFSNDKLIRKIERNISYY
jgi:hypothetical protein